MGVLTLFRFATAWDVVLISLGVLCSFVNGLSLPAFSVLLGRLLDEISKADSYSDGVRSTVLAFVVGGGVVFCTGLFGQALLNVSATRQVRVWSACGSVYGAQR